jgi:hypothetical protein
LAFVSFIALLTLPALWSPLGDSLPMSITGHAQALLSGTWGAGDLVGPVLGGLLLAVVGAGASCLVLIRREV